MRVLIDTREKSPWQFNNPEITSAEIKKLDTGDYTVEGLEHLLCIERKRGAAEFAGNTTSKRFLNELERIKEYKYRYIIFECSELDIVEYPKGTNIPQKLWYKLRVRGKYMLHFIKEIEEDYGITVIFAGGITEGELAAIKIMKEVCDNERLSADTET